MNQQLVAEAKALRDRLSDRHNTYFDQGMPLPNSAVARARYRRLIQKASIRYVRRMLKATDWQARAQIYRESRYAR